MTDFNLVDDPWIRVRAGDDTHLVGIREVLLSPDRFTSFETDEVDEFFAVVRLLTTIINRALDGPRNPAAWAEIAGGGGYDARKIDEYLSRWRDRFGLFDPARPFLQYSELAGHADAPASVLRPSVASGNAITLFSHSSEKDVQALSPAEAAQGLVHVVLNGRGALKGGEYGIFGARVAVLGTSVEQVLIQNLPRLVPRKDDLPVWEHSRPRALPANPRKSPQPCRGLMDYSTWQWRGLLLRRDDDGLVRRCVFGAAPPPDGEPPLDPSRWYRVPNDEERKKNPKLPARLDHRLRADRDVWRDADALVAALAATSTPGVLAWNIDYRDEEAFDILVGGPIAELKGSWVITGIRSGTLPLPRPLLTDDRLMTRVSAAVEFSKRAGDALYWAVRTMVEELVRAAPGQQPGHKRVGPLVKALDPAKGYWAALPVHFERLLRDVADPGALGRWQDEVRAQARVALAGALSGIAPTPQGLRASAAASRRLNHELSKISPPPAVPASPTATEEVPA